MKTEVAQAPAELENGDIPEHFFKELDTQILIHELKGPTGIIVTVLRSLLEKKEKYGPLSTRQEKALQRALKAVLQTQNTLHDLLEIGRSEAGQFVYRVFQPKKEIYSCLLETLEIMEGEIFERVHDCQSEREVLTVLSNAGISFVNTAELETLEITQDDTKFRQVVGNLLKNAFRFRNTCLKISCYQKGPILCVDVEDDGPGIKPEEHDMIFQRYTQVKGGQSLERKGHGLGLAGVLIQAKRLGGNIIVQSEAGKGALFRFTIPIHHKEEKLWQQQNRM